MIKFTKEELILKLRKKAKELGRQPTKRNSLEFYYFARKYFGTWGNLLREAKFNLKTLQKPTIPRRVTHELSYFLGLLVTDGHISKDRLNRHKIFLFTSYCDEKEIILELIKRLFNYKASVRTKKYAFNKSPNYEIYISSKPLAKYFINKFEIPAGAKSHIIRTPKFLSNEKDISSFIRGVIDGDGTISSKSKCVRIASGSEKFLKDIKKLLLDIGVSSGSILKDKGSNTWVLYISGLDNLRRLRYKIYYNSRFFYPRKKASWKDI